MDNAIRVVLNKPEDKYLDDKFDLCPFCHSVGNKSKPNKLAFSNLKLTSSNKRYLDIVFDFREHMECTASDIAYPRNMMQVSDYKDNLVGLRYVGNKDGFEFDVSQVLLTPHFRYDDDVSFDYKLVGYSTTPRSDVVQYPCDKVFRENDFPTGKSGITLYPVWQGKCVIEFDRGESHATDDWMSPIVVDLGNEMVVPSCPYSSGDTVNQFTYHESSKGTWEHVDWPKSEVEKFKFSRWECVVNGLVFKLNPGDKLKVDLPSSSSPILKFVAKWETKYDKIRFLVEDELYCEVLIDKSKNELVYPDHNPIYKASREVVFLGWSMVEGTYLGGILDPIRVICENDTGKDGKVIGSEDDVQVVCPPEVEPTLVICEGESGKVICIMPEPLRYPIVCNKEDILTYSMSVNARMCIAKDATFKLTFKYLGMEDGIVDWRESKFDMPENHKLPFFHIHQRIFWQDQDLEFRYWKVESGNLTSSLTMMSDVTLVAVYDSLEEPSREDETKQIEIDLTKKTHEPAEQDEIEIGTCPYAEKLADGRSICTFNVLSPANRETEKVRASCAKINGLDIPSHTDNDFGLGTILEIGDIAKLLKALFKVNIDIAHREYYLKKDIQMDSGWWYGQVMNGYNLMCEDESQIVCPGFPEDYEVVCGDDGRKFPTKWISFEPTVEIKFSNFHSDNQIVDGKLICTSSEIGQEGRKIVPINRGLANDPMGMHHNDFLYCYDYVNKLRMVVSRDGDVDWETQLDDNQMYYQVSPLHLYEDTWIQSPTDPNGFVKRRQNAIPRSNKQVQTFSAIVKKYRPIVMPKVQDIFDDCQRKTQYEAHQEGTYGVFGWCTIPSKTMVNMEYNEDAIMVPSSYDHFNRIGSKSFLQLDPDLADLYVHYDKDSKKLVSNASETWYFLYDKRDWTYFLSPFFNLSRNYNVYQRLVD